MTEEHDNNEHNQPGGTGAWAKNWYVPVILLMLREWNSYGYELMEKLSAFGLNMMNSFFSLYTSRPKQRKPENEQ